MLWLFRREVGPAISQSWSEVGLGVCHGSSTNPNCSTTLMSQY
jgi:hypothetical protein